MARVVGLALAALGLLAAPAAGQGFTMKMSGDIVIPAGSVHEGLAVTMNGRIVVDGTLRGDAMTMNGDITVAGLVTGSVRTFNGNVILMPTARVDGDVTAVNGRVDQRPGAVVRGRISQGGVTVGPMPPSRPPAPPGEVQPRPSPWRQRVWEWWGTWPPGAFIRLATAWMAASLTVLAALLALLFPAALRRIVAGMDAEPGVALLLGLGLWVVLPPLAAALVFSLVGIPVVMFLPVTVAALGVIGFAASAMLLGGRLIEAFRRGAGAVVDTVVGALILVVLALVPVLGWLVLFLAVTWGVGGVLLRGFRGLRGHPQAPSAS